MDLPFLLDVMRRLAAGLPMTLNLAAVSIALGGMLALGLALLQRTGSLVATAPIALFVAVFRGTPLLVQIFLIYYGLGQFRPFLQDVGLWSLLREPFWCAILALTLNTAAYGCEIIRGALQSVPKGEIEAARACGMSEVLILRRIALPVGLRLALPAYGNEIILMIKGTSLASVVTLMEVTGVAHGLISQTYRAVEIFACAGAIYLSLNFIVTRLLQALERSLSPHLRPQPAALAPVRGAAC